MKLATLIVILLAVFVREAAAEALGMLKDTRAVEPLTQALKDEDGFVRLKRT